MTGETIQVDDREFEAAFSAVLKEIDALCEKAGTATAKRVRDIAQDLVHKDTEKLVIDIQIRGSGRDENGYYVDVGTVEADVVYGLYQEFGTKKMTARPFMRPAIAQATRDGLTPAAL